MPSTHLDNEASMEGSHELGPMIIKLLIFARVEKLANPVAMEDTRFESEDSRFSLEKKFFYPPA
jgi:hypothetical protein